VAPAYSIGAGENCVRTAFSYVLVREQSCGEVGRELSLADEMAQAAPVLRVIKVKA